jgi:hypothetical protein
MLTLEQRISALCNQDSCAAFHLCWLDGTEADKVRYAELTIVAFAGRRGGLLASTSSIQPGHWLAVRTVGGTWQCGKPPAIVADPIRLA